MSFSLSSYASIDRLEAVYIRYRKPLPVPFAKNVGPVSSSLYCVARLTGCDTRSLCRSSSVGPRCTISCRTERCQILKLSCLSLGVDWREAVVSFTHLAGHLGAQTPRLDPDVRKLDEAPYQESVVRFTLDGRPLWR